MKNIFQAPNGKWFYKTYDESGSIIFNSYQAGEVFETQLEAFEASNGKGEVEVVETKAKTKAKK